MKCAARFPRGAFLSYRWAISSMHLSAFHKVHGTSFHVVCEVVRHFIKNNDATGIISLFKVTLYINIPNTSFKI